MDDRAENTGPFHPRPVTTADLEAAHARDREAMVRRCAGKVRFAHMRDAEREIIRRRDDHGQMSPYGCPNCGGYHVGHRRFRG